MASISTSNSFPKSTLVTLDCPAPIQASLSKNAQDRWLTIALDRERCPEPQLSQEPECNLSMPLISLRGAWLKEAGFVPCDRIRVRVMPGCLVITCE